jgi:hypothetical protein
MAFGLPLTPPLQPMLIKPWVLASARADLHASLEQAPASQH